VALPSSRDRAAVVAVIARPRSGSGRDRHRETAKRSRRSRLPWIASRPGALAMTTCSWLMTRPRSCRREPSSRDRVAVVAVIARPRRGRGPSSRDRAAAALVAVIARPQKRSWRSRLPWIASRPGALAMTTCSWLMMIPRSCRREPSSRDRAAVVALPSSRDRAAVVGRHRETAKRSWRSRSPRTFLDCFRAVPALAMTTPNGSGSCDSEYQLSSRPNEGA